MSGDGSDALFRAVGTGAQDGQARQRRLAEPGGGYDAENFSGLT